MATLTIPLENVSPQFSFTIQLDGNQVEMSFKWNLTGQYWTFGIKGDSFDDQVQGAGVTVGLNLLGPYAIRELGQLYCVDLQDLGEDPDFDNFGTRWILMYVEK